MSAFRTIPLLRFHHPDAVFARYHDAPVSASRFLMDVITVAGRLPTRPYQLNLCNDRYHFAVGFGAALVRGQITLLPPNHTPDLLQRLSRRYPGVYCLSDDANAAIALPSVPYPDFSALESWPAPMPEIAAQQLAAIMFTSGSTGDPVPHEKTWGALAQDINNGGRRLGILERGDLTLLGTVPPQHMFGLEATVMNTLQGGNILHAARPFYPADIAAALDAIPGARALVTTPVHLRVLIDSGIALPALDLILCATAPLSQALARQAETRFNAPLKEIYGSTETGQIASRRTATTDLWRTLDGIVLRQQDEVTYVSGGHVRAELALHDLIELRGDTSFVLHGRTADLINIAGKRTSLASLNHHLSEIAGVVDGVFFMPDHSEDNTTRLAAFVVAPGLDPAAILHALRERIDPVFLPRPLLSVEALPRDATGKLARASLEHLLQQARRGA